MHFSKAFIIAALASSVVAVAIPIPGIQPAVLVTRNEANLVVGKRSGEGLVVADKEKYDRRSGEGLVVADKEKYDRRSGEGLVVADKEKYDRRSGEGLVVADKEKYD
ncbi:hypothetical protein ACEPPN_001617 [Leptodophora sp. 'Broadleaf-Isolate-01']